MSIPAREYPIRAVGGNVLLRRVQNADAYSSILKLVGGKDGRVLQIGEVLGVGSRWTQDSQWSPPIPNQDRARSESLEREGRALVGERPGVSEWNPMRRFADSSTYRPLPPAFSLGHKLALADVQPGDLVVYNAARIYDYFEFEGDNVLLYPGNWIYGVVEQTNIAEQPELREYDRVADL